MSANVCMCAHA